MRYMSDDNKVFNSEQECLNHEKAIATERAKRERLLTEKNKRSDEIRKLGDDFIKLHNKFVEDYGEEITFNNDLESLASFYSAYPFFFRSGRLI